MKTFAWIIRPLILGAGVGLAAAALSWLPAPWASWPPDDCRGQNCFCEPITSGFVAQPIAAYSNLAFVLAGLLILAAPPEGAGEASLMGGRRAYPRTYGAACLAIGFGSFFYHASLTRAGEWFDLLGMYLLASFLLLYNLARLRPAPGWLFALTYGVVNGLLGVQMLVARELQQVIFLALIAGALTVEALNFVRYRPRAAYGYLIGALGCFAVGGAFWILDSAGALPCSPHGLWQWHAVWHLLAASAAWLLFSFYRSEGAAARAAGR